MGPGGDDSDKDLALGDKTHSSIWFCAGEAFLSKRHSWISRLRKLGIFMEIVLIQMSSPDPICLQVPGMAHREPLTLDRWTPFALLGQGHGAGSTVDMEHEHVDIWKFTDGFEIVCLSASSQHRFLWRHLFLPSPSPHGLPHAPLHPHASPLHLPAYSRSSVFPPLPLLPAPPPSSPGLLPQPFSSSPRTIFFPSSHLLAAASVCPSLFPPSSPLPIVFFPSLLFATVFSPPHHFLPVSISPPSRSSDFLPLFSLPASSPHRLLPRSSSRPLPSSRSLTAFHLEALHACARLCPCTRCVSALRQPLSWAPELRPSSQLETPESRCLCHRGCCRRYLRTEQCWLQVEDSGARRLRGEGEEGMEKEGRGNIQRPTGKMAMRQGRQSGVMLPTVTECQGELETTRS
ncbi:uncharacterized protein LOC117086925 [Trachypithecus francoisi]|uniref:uncharacterized protein LOC117086925 n=1 Tax=Trachypithecus francoisi TaxID=54180 RepID=UPI00141AC8B6|nr:uncharacterized protein LOC117086925 [Trachypithecus francoisi]